MRFKVVSSMCTFATTTKLVPVAVAVVAVVVAEVMVVMEAAAFAAVVARVDGRAKSAPRGIGPT
ncbi:uncharacterized protein B0T15DRAFT_499145 [Chaetomium strumarium]|uniref:Uncharacterized protein n=1 Tax=Chaetomium strumarium TaxID=1170767 RepID=A0AAJ0M6X5_9PEZI|nr:hypothetical protein B0T15DRAFT_499145 [Chaetomium strumarium]